MRNANALREKVTGRVESRRSLNDCDDGYLALNKLLAAMNLLRYLLRYKWLILDKRVNFTDLSSLTIYGKYIIQPKRSKIALVAGAIGTFGP